MKKSRKLLMSDLERLWKRYWEDHGFLQIWHARTYERRVKGVGCELSPTHDSENNRVIIRAKSSEKADSISLFAGITKNYKIVFFRFLPNEGIVIVQLETPQNTARFLENAKSKLACEPAPSRSVRLCPTKVRVKGSALKTYMSDFSKGMDKLKDLFLIFGPCTIHIIEENFHIVVEYTDPKLGAADAYACVEGIQHFLAVDWCLVVCYEPDTSAPTPTPTPVEDGLPMIAKPSLAEQHREAVLGYQTSKKVRTEQVKPPPTQRCKDDGLCPLVNDKAHQKEFLHRCTNPAPCPWLNIASHTRYFVHN